MRYVVGLDELDRTQVAVAGGKTANLGELSRIEGVRVPGGFCVTTAAFQAVLTAVPGFDELRGRLEQLRSDDLEGIRDLSAQLRQVIEAVVVPDDIATAVTDALGRFAPDTAYAVRSSATAEDLPNASFAGQQDSYLNVHGVASILEHITRCWASLFTERAVIYRRHNGFADHQVAMAVLVQQLIDPAAAGILFTADPITSNRKVAAVEASLGFGEALVSGLITPDTFHVRGTDVIARTITSKRLAIRTTAGGGTTAQDIETDEPALTDGQVIELVGLGRRIETHFGQAQDIEWCLDGDGFAIAQSRPITTLFPIPPVDDGENHVYISVGHQQMMTDAMKPLGLSFWQLTTPRPMHESGGRLFVDVAPVLGSPATSAACVAGFTKSDPLIGTALQHILDRGDFVKMLPAADSRPLPSGLAQDESAGLETDPNIVTELIADNQASLAILRREIGAVTGPALFDFIRQDLIELKRHLFGAVSHQVIMAGMEATWWLNEHLEEWLGEKNAADVLTQSVPHNVTSEMGLALLDVADVIRPHRSVVKFLSQLDDTTDGSFLDELAGLPGGEESASAVGVFLDRYGMRCAGEIDLTRPRWSEQPATLVPTILSNVQNFSAGAGQQRFDLGRDQAEQKEQELLARLRHLPDGEQKASQVRNMIERVRTFAGYREYPKYGMVSRYYLYKQALLAEADRLVRAGVVHEREDIYYLRFDELAEASRTNRLDQQLIAERREAYRSYLGLTPPRVSTSDGEVITGHYRHAALPAGALAGLPVSVGTVEGRARVVLDLGQAQLEPGDILVTAYTDPSWTPLFVAVAGLVTEVGGAMTHGAVVAREYGLPAVVGVQRATELIRDGQRIRVHGTDGYVELLP